MEVYVKSATRDYAYACSRADASRCYLNPANRQGQVQMQILVEKENAAELIM